MPIQTILLQLADALADQIGWLHRPMGAHALIQIARQRTGLHDFGDVALEAPLRHLLEPCLTEADLSLVGRMATRWDVVRFLSNLLQMHDAERRNPAILEQPVAPPVFITGLPRSGTTFLHRMLMEDPANRAPLVWQAIHPYPPPHGRDRRQATVARQLRSFEWLAPEFRALHPLQADSPQECSEITAHVFRSLRFDSTYNIPSYRAWLDTDAAGHQPAYRFHRRFLQHLQQQDSSWSAGTRWVLKCPDHVFALDALRTVYPDARLVFVHRDPVKVLLSVAKLTEVLRRPFSRHVDPLAIGRQESARWLDGTRRMMAASETAGLSPSICHVHYLDLVSDPVSTVEQVYQHFGMVLRPEASRRWSATWRRGRMAATGCIATTSRTTAWIPRWSGRRSGRTCCISASSRRRRAPGVARWCGTPLPRSGPRTTLPELVTRFELTPSWRAKARHPRLAGRDYRPGGGSQPRVSRGKSWVAGLRPPRRDTTRQ